MSSYETIEGTGWVGFNGRPPRAPDPAPPKKSGLLARLAAPLVLAVKFKLVVPLLSMAASVGAYALLWGWQFALGFVALLFVHECGHAIELRRQGVKAGLPVFIPFLGALIAMKELPRDAYREAKMALAGPLLGSAAALAVFLAAKATGSNLLLALAYTGFFLNLFNLFPVLPLDGGRAAAALSPKLWLVGLVGLAAFIVVAHAYALAFIFAVLGVPELAARWRRRRHPEQEHYYKVKPWQRLGVAVVFVGLAAALVLGMSASHIAASSL
jgi:Zn-dependent protease